MRLLWYGKLSNGVLNTATANACQIKGLPIELLNCGNSSIVSTPIPVLLKGSGTLCRESDSSLIATLQGPALKALQVLQNENDLDLQLLCWPSSSPKATKGRDRKLQKAFKPSAYLSVIIYGSLDLFDDVGEFLQKCEMYLQDPPLSQRSFPYRNPHRLFGPEDESPSKDQQELEQSSLDMEIVKGFADPFAGLEYEKYLPETEGSCALATPLHR